MIKPLLEYQTKEKEKLQIVQSVENSRAKRELDEALRVIESGKRVLLTLENDAQNLRASFEQAKKNLATLLATIENYEKSEKDTDSEEAITESLNHMSSILGNVGVLEQQLVSITSKIDAKTQAFEDAKMQVVRAQKTKANAEAEYEKQKKEIKPKIDAINAQLEKLGQAVDKTLLDTYKKARKNSAESSITDIAVPLANNRCGGCHFELPLSLIHKINATDYILCEECNRIIYKS